jgi:hypothetical protein
MSHPYIGHQNYAPITAFPPAEKTKRFTIRKNAGPFGPAF